MDGNSRYGLVVLWVAVALLLAATMRGVDVASLAGVARLVGIALSLFLAVVYAFDPFGVLDRRPF